MVLFHHPLLKIKDQLPILNSDLYNIDYHGTGITGYIIRYGDLTRKITFNEFTKRIIKNKESVKAKLLALLLRPRFFYSGKFTSLAHIRFHGTLNNNYILLRKEDMIKQLMIITLSDKVTSLFVFHFLGILDLMLNRTISNANSVFEQFIKKVKSVTEYGMCINYLLSRKLIKSKKVRYPSYFDIKFSKDMIKILDSEIFWSFLPLYKAEIQLILNVFYNQSQYKKLLNYVKVLGINDIDEAPHRVLYESSIYDETYENLIYSLGTETYKKDKTIYAILNKFVKNPNNFPYKELSQKHIENLFLAISTIMNVKKLPEKIEMINKLYSLIKNDYENYYKTFFEDPIVWGTNIEDRGKGILLINMLLKNYVGAYNNKELPNPRVYDNPKRKDIGLQVKGVIEHLKRYNLWRNDEIKTVIDIIHGAMDKEKKVMKMFKTLNKEYLIDRPLKYSER